MFQLSIPTWGSVNNFWSFPGTLVGYVRLKDAADLYNFYGIFIAIVFKKHKALYSIKKCFLCKMEHVHWRRSSNKKKYIYCSFPMKIKGEQTNIYWHLFRYDADVSLSSHKNYLLQLCRWNDYVFARLIYERLVWGVFKTQSNIYDGPFWKN